MDALNYVLFKNPVISYSLDAVKYVASATGGLAVGEKTTKVLTKADLWKMLELNRNYIRIAGLFGAAAVVLGAYGAHTIHTNPKISDHAKQVFDTANRYHFIHSLALIAVPFCHFPKITGIIMANGIILFCGTCYYESITGNSTFRRLTPIGGSLLIVGWLSMLL